MMEQESSGKLDVAEHDLQYKQKGSKQEGERGAILLEVVIASLFLLLVMSMGNRLLGFYHLNYQKLFITHQVLMQKQNER
ncbi:hypothetical protein WMO13_01000 [Ignatzschineria larvae DSM 13226]|uniref:Prepilin-type N-terminal cleavage/methylation domain-containing protein n=1 Tax=Ignatzschineria larvae DSM 13226 TaxID=1111732 RepID=A0ABZ3BZM1_9GAMM|nr:hypothetical protein [Ignatzschineria larvae]